MSQTESGWGPRAWYRLAAGLVLLLPLVVYGRTLGFDLIGYDDPVTITANPFWAEPSLATFVDCFTRVRLGVYHPLFFAEVFVQRALWGPTAFGLRLAQLLAFVGCVGLLMRLSRRLGLSPRAALFAGLIFAVHPTHAESIAWVTARGGPLVGLCLLGASLVYLRGERLSKGRAAAILLLFVVGLGIKSNFAVVLVPWLVLLAAARGRLKADAPWLAVTLVVGLTWTVVTVSTQASFGDVGGVGGSEQVQTLLRAQVHYTRFALVPDPLSPTHPAPDLSGGWGLTEAVGVFLLLGGVVACVELWRRGHTLAVSLVAMFYAALAPMSHIVPFNHFVQDRYLFLPCVPLAILAGLLLAKVRSRRVVLGVLLVVAGLLTTAGLRYSRAWSDDVSLAEWASTAYPDDPAIREQLAAALLGRGGPGDEDAAMWMLVALSSGKRSHRTHLLLGLLLQKRGRLGEAQEQFELGMGFTGNLTYQCGLHLMQLLIERDDLAGARAWLEPTRERAAEGLRGEVFLVEGHLLLAEGDTAAAAERYRRALEAFPGWPLAWLGLARAERLAGNQDAARDALDGAGGAPGVPALLGHLALDAGNVQAARDRAAESGFNRDLDLLRLRLAVRDGTGLSPEAAQGFAGRWGPAGVRRARMEPDLAGVFPPD